MSRKYGRLGFRSPPNCRSNYDCLAVGAACLVFAQKSMSRVAQKKRFGHGVRWQEEIAALLTLPLMLKRSVLQQVCSLYCYYAPPTPAGPTYPIGIFCGSVSFDGANDRIFILT